MKQYYLQSDGEGCSGPYSVAELLALRADGSITDESLVLADGNPVLQRMAVVQAALDASRPEANEPSEPVETEKTGARPKLRLRGGAPESAENTPNAPGQPEPRMAAFIPAKKNLALRQETSIDGINARDETAEVSAEGILRENLSLEKEMTVEDWVALRKRTSRGGRKPWAEYFWAVLFSTVALGIMLGLLAAIGFLNVVSGLFLLIGYGLFLLGFAWVNFFVIRR